MLKPIRIKTESSWQEILQDLVTDPKELLTIVGLDHQKLGLSLNAIKDFPLKVPRPYLNRINYGDPDDPLLKQVLPVTDEMEIVPGFTIDPLGEEAFNPEQGLLHKYQGRVLLVTTSSCAIHCRYCFRRHFPYQDNNPGKKQWQQTFQYIAADPSIHEVILSGGDPLTLSDKYFQWLVDELSSISHLQRLRIHTRLPIMIPQRVNVGLCDYLAASRFNCVVVIHSNHANEIDAEVLRACCRLRDAGVSLLNQSVLLKGINDSKQALIGLSERLFEAGVLPYYLYLLDKVQGAAHFEVDEIKAKVLMKQIQAELPGYLVPRLVKEEPGFPAKVIVDIENTI